MMIKMMTKGRIQDFKGEQEEVINETPTTDKIDLIEREQEEATN